jgi:hypothetical protein
MHVTIFFFFVLYLTLFILIDRITVVTIRQFLKARTTLVNPISAMLIFFHITISTTRLLNQQRRSFPFSVPMPFFCFSFSLDSIRD